MPRQIDLFEDEAGGLHMVDRARRAGWNGFEWARDDGEPDVCGPGREAFSFAFDAPRFDDLGEGIYEPMDAAGVEALYEREGESGAAVRVATWHDDGAIAVHTTNLGASARWYIVLGSDSGSRLQRLQALLGADFTTTDLRSAYKADPAAVRAAGGASWTLRGLSLGEFETQEAAERYLRGTGIRGNHPAIEGPASRDYVLGLAAPSAARPARVKRARDRG